MTFWLVANSAAILIVAGLLYLTIRQVGLLLQRVGPLGARHNENMGPRIGENIAPYVHPLQEGARGFPKPKLYVFVSNACPICEVVQKAAMKLAPHWKDQAEIVAVHDEAPRRMEQLEAVPSEGFAQVRDSKVREKIGVTAVPYAVMTDPDGVVLGHGLVNAISHLESLLELLDVDKRERSLVHSGSLQGSYRGRNGRAEPEEIGV